MSTKQIFRSGLMATAGLATLGLTACANSHASSTRYGATTHYDYEGVTCGSACGYNPAPAPIAHAPAPYRPAPPVALSHYDYEGVPCRSKCGPSYSTGFSSGVISSHPTTTISSPSYATETAPCPAGTTSQPDGTCLQGGSFSSYSSGSVFSGGSSSYSSSSYSSGSLSSGGIADCPAGTTSQPDGSCLQHSGSSFSSHTTSTYTAPVTSTYTAPVTSTYTGTTSTYVAPELTTDCCGPVSSTTTYTGPAATNTFSGYATSGSTYSSSDYLPIRK